MVKVVLFMGYLVFCSFYASNLTPQEYDTLELANRAFMFSVIFQCISESLAFGVRPGRKKEFAFQVVACLYVFGVLLYKVEFEVLNSGHSVDRALSGVVIFLQVFRYLKRNYPLT